MVISLAWAGGSLCAAPLPKPVRLTCPGDPLHPYRHRVLGTVSRPPEAPVSLMGRTQRDQRGGYEEPSGPPFACRHALLAGAVRRFGGVGRPTLSPCRFVRLCCRSRYEDRGGRGIDRRC